MGLKVAEMSEYTQRHFHQLQYTNFSQKKLAKCVPLVQQTLIPYFGLIKCKSRLVCSP